MTTTSIILAGLAYLAGYLTGYVHYREQPDKKKRKASGTRFELYAPGKDAGEADGCDCKWIGPGTLIANEAMQAKTEGWGRIHDHDCPKHGASK